MNVSKKIIAVFSCIAIIISCMAFPVSASGGVSGAVQTFLEWSVKSGEDVVNGFWKVIYGDDWRSADREQLQSAYITYVTDLESDLGSATIGYDSDGIYLEMLLPTSVSYSSYYYRDVKKSVDGSLTATFSGIQYDTATSSHSVRVDTNTVYCPIDCRFARYFIFGSHNFPTQSRGEFGKIEVYTSSNKSKGSAVYGSTVFEVLGYGSTDYLPVSLSLSLQVFGRFYPPLTESLPTSQDITINSRPTSITGDYGIIGDDGSITKVDGNVIVDESTSTVYNPVTNTTTNYTSWAYDYSDRSYNLTTEAGDTITVTYGDENITINEGDTVYNVYYLVESEPEGGGGGSGGSGSGDTHTHTYTDEITKQPSCLLSGVRTYTCSCGDSYTKTVPATGHDWQITQQVPNTYDPETGEQTQAGYTVYTCATCGEQYKSTDGQAPPNGSTGDSEKETIWDKIGNLFGTIGNGFLGIIDAIVGKLLDGLISLAETISTKLKSVVEMVLSWFDEIPALFGGFLSFLGALFPFLPDECIMLLEFGLAAVIFIAIINLLRRR